MEVKGLLRELLEVLDMEPVNSHVRLPFYPRPGRLARGFFRLRSWSDLSAMGQSTWWTRGHRSGLRVKTIFRRAAKPVIATALGFKSSKGM
jgi:hypothetical protein